MASVKSVPTARQALEQLCESYAREFEDDGYDKRDMVDFVVAQTLGDDLEALSQAHGMGWPSLLAWYESRAAYIKRTMAEFKESEIEIGSPTEEQRARRGKVR